MRSDEEFSPLRIVKKNLAGSDQSIYRVYKSPTEFVSVEAATALEAFRESGIKNPYRIMRETRFMERLVDQGKFSDMEELIETGLVVDASNSPLARQEPTAPPANISTDAEEPATADITEGVGESNITSDQEDNGEEEALSPEEVSNLLKEE